uniref:putative Ig domain-containing protein n=3 Tax=Acidovorax sp. sic0104 TaxID=2854784 RepID=UPI001C46EA0D
MAASASPAPNEIVFVFDNLPNWQQLANSVRPGAQVVVLDGSRDGLVQIAQYLEGRSGIDALHILSHGGQGQLQLGSRVLDAAALTADADVLERIGQALGEDGDILLYGCNVAEGQVGAAFLETWATLSRADVAASTNPTGSDLLGGDWVLERHSGSIKAGHFSRGGAVDYAGLLAAPTTENFDGVMVTDGHSLGTAGQPRTINGWTFTMLGADGNPDTGIYSYIDVTNVASETSLANDGPDHAAALNGTYVAGTGLAAAVMASSDGSEFAFQSIVVEQYLSGGADYRLIGYRDGSAVSGATQDFTAGPYPNGGALVTVSGNAWGNLDAVYIVRQNGTTDISIYVDDITVAPVTRPTATVVVTDSSLTAGESSLVTFTFSQAVTGFTNADLTIPNGLLTPVSSSNGGITWTAAFTPTDGISAATNQIVLNMAGVTTVATSVAGTGTQNSNSYAIDTQPPTVTAVSATSANGGYSPGQTINITVTFSESVTVTGTPQLTLETGAMDQPVNYTGGSGTSTLTFAYTVQAGDATTDLDYTSTSALALNGGTVRDALGNNANLTLPTPGAAGSLGANKNIFINMAPTVANAIPNQNATEDAAFSFQFAANTFFDADVGDTLNYTAQTAGGGALPAWLSFDPATRTFSGTPANSHVGTLSIDVVASDGRGGSVTDTFDVVVANTNDAPTVASAVPNQNATEDAAFSFQFAANTFADVDASDTLTYTAQLSGGGALPAWLSFNAATRTFSGTPANGDVGTLSIQITADDGNGGIVTDTFDVVVANTNDAPTVANTIPDRSATQGAAFSFQFAANTFADADVGDTLSYSAQLAGGGALPAWLSFDPATRTFSGTPANGDVGSVDIDVIASDGNGGSVTDTFAITVGNVNDNPTVANAIPNQNAS